MTINFCQKYKPVFLTRQIIFPGWYRYIDMTPQAEALFGFIDRTIDAELARELAFLAHYDKAKRTIQEIADTPDLIAMHSWNRTSSYWTYGVLRCPIMT
jgi:hypothetical protein